MKNLLLFIILFIFTWGCTGDQKKSKDLSSEEDIEETIMGSKPYEDHLWNRNYPETAFDHNRYLKAIMNESKKARSRTATGSWIDEGPGNIGGRVNCMAIQPDNDQVIYIGYAMGGLYKTIDGGSNWTSIFDEYTYLSISHIEIDPLDSDIIYIGTGDENISSFIGLGNGVYKSKNGGLSWTNIGLKEENIITNIHVAPTDTDVIYASAQGIPMQKNDARGVYKSIDAGNTWDQVLLVNDSTGITDMVVHPTNPDIVYAASWHRMRSNYASSTAGPEDKIWKTIDGGTTWNELTNGLPTENVARIGLEMWEGDPEVIFASFSTIGEVENCGISGVQFSGIYKTINGGDNWEKIPTSEENGLQCFSQGGFAWYFGQIRVNPDDVNHISLLGVNHHITTDGGQSWDYADQKLDAHVDYHELVYHDKIMYIGTDGGAYKSDESGGWIDIEDISTNQVYRLAYNPHQPDTYYGGLQDNGSVSGSHLVFDNWDHFWGGDGFQMVFHPQDPDIYFVETQFGNITLRTDGSSSNFSEGLNSNRNWDMPYFLSTVEDNTLYTGTDRVYKRHIYDDVEWIPISENITDIDDNSPYYTHNVSTIHQSVLNPLNLYVGTSDGLVHRQDEDGSWANISDGLIRRYITDIKASPSEENTVYVTLSGFRNNDSTPLVYRSDDRGDNWVSIMGDLPPLAVNDILILEGYEDQVLFIGNESGVYITKNGGENWERLGDNFPFVQVFDLEYNPVHNQVIAGSFGRGIQTFDIDQLDLDINVATVDNSRLKLKVYPTIVTDLVTIHNPENLKISGQIYDISGHLIESQENVESTINLDVLTSGLYFLRLRSGDKTQTTKLIKQ